MRKLKPSSPLPFSRVRGYIALGGCLVLTGILLPGFDSRAAESGNEPVEIVEEMEEIENEPITLPGTTLPDDTPDDSSGEARPDIPEDSLDEDTLEDGLELSETLISILGEKLNSSDEVIVYDDLSEFEALPASVDRYQYELLKRLEFLQYCAVILIGLIFVLIFRKK